MNSQKMKMKLQQKLTPQQLLLMKLLQLPVTQLEQKIKDEIEKNPMLEVDSDNEEAAAEENYDAYDEGENGENDDYNDDFHGIDMNDYLDDDDYSYRERLERDPNAEVHHMEMTSGPSFTESLLSQLRLRNLSEQERSICMEIIGSLDSDGYLSRDMQLIANDMAFRSGIDVSDTQMEQMLKEVQSLDPAGVGARSLQECLSIQLHRSEEKSDAVELATTIVDHYFSMLSNKHYNALMSQLKIDELELNDALETIRRLNPKPGWGFEEEHKGAHYIVPDFIVMHEGENVSFALNERQNPKLHLNNEYSEMLQELSSQKELNKGQRDTLKFIKEKSDDATWLIDTLRQRQVTLYNTMAAIVKYQHAYFVSGLPDDLRPMRLKDIAEETGYDESTISRVATQKYVQTDNGTFLLKELFSKAVTNDKGESLVTDKVKELLRNIIDNEDKQNPLTDEALTEKLKAEGLQLSRRTVAKYRESMGIAVGRLRKEI